LRVHRNKHAWKHFVDISFVNRKWHSGRQNLQCLKTRWWILVYSGNETNPLQCMRPE